MSTRNPSHRVSGLRDILRHQGRRPSWVADQLGVDRTTVFRWCSGERTIPSDHLRQLADLLGMPEKAIVGDHGPVGAQQPDVAQLGWTPEEAMETRLRLKTFAEDWDAPGMDAYDDL